MAPCKNCGGTGKVEVVKWGESCGMGTCGACNGSGEENDILRGIQDGAETLLGIFTLGLFGGGSRNRDDRDTPSDYTDYEG